MWPWEESFKSSRVVLDWQSPTNHAREPWRQGPSDPHKTDTLGVQHQGAACVSRGPRAHLTPIRQIRLESSTRMLPGLEFHLVAVIFVTVTAVICKAQRTVVEVQAALCFHREPLSRPQLLGPTPMPHLTGPTPEGPPFQSIPRSLWGWWTGIYHGGGGGEALAPSWAL